MQARDGQPGPTPGPTIGELVAGYRSGRLRPADVVDEALDRIALRGDDGTWISLLDRGEVRARAAQLEQRVDPRSAPLFGVPFAVKDSIDVAGVPTTLACPDYAYLPTDTAVVVARLVAAGAIYLGKTNLDQFATGLNGTRTPYPMPRSVFGGGLICGGSSSGSALAVATGDVPFAVATDTAGSGRVPPALNGVAGFKPSRGLISTTGLVPACRSLDCISLIAATVPDLAAVFDEVAAFDRRDPYSRLRRREDADPFSLRVGMPPLRELEFFGDDLMRQAHAAARSRVERTFDRTVVTPFGAFTAAGELLYEGPWVAERLTEFGDFVSQHPESVLPVIREILASGARYSAVDVFAAQHRLGELKAEVAALWDDMDVLVLPAVGTTFTIDQVLRDPVATNTALGHYTHFGNLLDLCAAVVPAGLTSDGRPAALMVLGPALADDRVLAVAGVLADAQPPTPRTSPVQGAPMFQRSESDPSAAVEVDARPSPFRMSLGSTALLVIDMQRDFLLPGGFGETLGNDVSQLQKVVPPLAAVIGAARASGMTVIHTREGHLPDLSDCPPAKLARGKPSQRIGDAGPHGRILIRGEYGHDIVDELAPTATEIVIDKPGKGAFYATELQAVLQRAGITELIVTGVTTEVCVHTTVREANDRGYNALVLSDCVGSYFPEFQRVGLDMIAAQGGIFGWVADSSALLSALSLPAFAG